jgi:hypothetical protein
MSGSFLEEDPRNVARRARADYRTKVQYALSRMGERKISPPAFVSAGEFL